MALKIDKEVLNTKISELKTLRDELDGVDVTAAQSTSGQGINFDMINNINAMYEALKTSLLTLLNNSVTYFQSVYDDAETTEAACKAHIEELGG